MAPTRETSMSDAAPIADKPLADPRPLFGRVVVKCITAPPRIEVITPEKVDVR